MTKSRFFRFSLFAFQAVSLLVAAFFSYVGRALRDGWSHLANSFHLDRIDHRLAYSGPAPVARHEAHVHRRSAARHI